MLALRARHGPAPCGLSAPPDASAAIKANHKAVWTAALTAAVPTLTVNVCYAISSAQGLTPACIPYFEGCTSISSAGRYGISYYLFKIGMACSAALLVLFWRQMSDRIRAATGRRAPVVAATGIGGAAFLVLYAAFLGSEGDFYFLMRRFGVLLYFGLTMVAQLMALRRLETFAPPWLTRTMKWILFSMLFFGFLSIPVMNYMNNKDTFQDIIEWDFSLLMQTYFLFTAIWLARPRKARLTG